jgi:OOP family OmpA-OmpF porin
MTWGSQSDEPPSLGGGSGGRDREERQKEWERSQVRERRSPSRNDRDRDGIVDEQDICPDEKPGRDPDPTMLGCPRRKGDRTSAPVVERDRDRDRDGDGVPDRDDRCPDVGFGSFPDPTSMGCPLTDRDRDGVPDLYDACPGKAGAPDPKPKANGCPGLVSIDGGMIQLARPIAFSGNGDHLAQGSAPVLQAVANALKAMPSIKKVSVEGHTDGSLDAMRSLDLSERRAESVRRWLMDNGVESDRLVTRGHGDTRPVASNKTAKGRAANSRVELIIIEPLGGGGLLP